MTIFRFPYDYRMVKVQSEHMHLARSRIRFVAIPSGEIYLAVDHDGSEPFAFQNTILSDSLLPLLMRTSNSRPMLVDVVVKRTTYPRVPSLLLALQLQTMNSQISPTMRVRVYFSGQILQEQFASLASCDGVFGRSDFPPDVMFSSTMIEFIVNWP